MWHRGSVPSMLTWDVSRRREPGSKEKRLTYAERRTTLLLSAEVSFLNNTVSYATVHSVISCNTSYNVHTVTLTQLVAVKGSIRDCSQNAQHVSCWLCLFLLPVLEKKLNDMNNMMNAKEEKLRGRHRDTHTALQWLRQNRNLFKGNVHEPMMLVVSPSEPYW